MAGLTSYYQVTYAAQANSLKQKTEEFNTALQELNIKKTMLNETSVQLQVESESKEQLSGLYTSVKEEKEVVEVDLSRTRDDLIRTVGELEQKKNELTIAEKERNAALSAADDWEDEAEEWEDRYDSCDDGLDSCEANLATCQGGE